MKKNNQSKAIGIVGGVGPYAGIDLTRKIFNNTIAKTDQEHIEIYLLSCSNSIPDRTAFLQNTAGVENPGIAIFNVIRKLHKIGADVIGIPCNTSHSSIIFNQIETLIKKDKLDVDLVNMIVETKKHIIKKHKNIKKVGLLATLGTYQSGIYSKEFLKDNIKIILPDDINKERVHKAIYDKTYGIKAFSNPVKDKAVNELIDITKKLIEKGADAVIMGCTEIPLALNRNKLNISLVDPTEILARALIERVDTGKLKH